MCEQHIEGSTFLPSMWSTSTIRTQIKSYTAEGGFMANLKQYMVPRTLTTAYTSNGSGGVTTDATTPSDPDYMFLLAYNDTSSEIYATQDFSIENYLGAEGSDLYKSWHPKSTSSLADSWWLRSGYYNGDGAAYYVYHNGYVGEYNIIRTFGVRPCFILNLA